MSLIHGDYDSPSLFFLILERKLRLQSHRSSYLSSEESLIAQDLSSVGAQALDGDVYPAGGGALFPYQLVVDGKSGEEAEVLFALPTRYTRVFHTLTLA